ncbi:MAG: PGF-pre-PGF domain-containing protein [Candidatus Methanoperedens sp.]|nr:PGF-pre-PGF domain-containing protein [Candidatus Methanoperedens sp.]
MSSITDPQTATGNFWINNTWVNPGFVDFNHTMFKFANDSVYMNVSNTTNFMNITYPPHYTQNLSAQTVDTSGNVDSIKVWFNASIQNNIPVQAGISDKTVTAGNWLNFTVSATDADGDTITYATNATKGSIDPLTGEFTWSTNSSDVGTYIWEFSSGDIYGGIDTEIITVTVNAAETYLPPSPVSISSSQGNFWINYTWSSGPGNVTDSYNVIVNGLWNNGSAVTYYNSTPGPHGWSNISVYAFNSSGTGSLNPVPLTSAIQISNNIPVQAGISDKTVTAGNLLNFTVSAADADGDTITYGTNATKGSIDPLTGEFTWSTNSSDVGTYIWEFSSSDIYGGIDIEIISVTVNAAIITTTETQSSSSSDGGIGGGVVSAEPYDNIDRSDMNEKYLILNTPVLFTFKIPELSIYEIAVTGKETEKNMALKVEALKGPTKNPGITALSGTVYKNLNVWASSKNIEEGQIRFRVENTWIANAGNDLRMVRWDGSKWIDLVTSEIKEDDMYTFYEANTDSFGSFAITTMKAEVVPTEVVEKTTADLAPVKPSSTPVPKETPGFEAIIAVFAITMLVALLKNNGLRR